MPNTRKTYSYVDDWRSLWEPDLDAIGFNGATCDPTKVDPKVLDWVKANCGADKPRFIKVINRNAAHGQPGLVAKSGPCLAVPAPFVAKHFRDLQRVVTLVKTGEPDKKWKVAFITPERNPLWLQGWRIVARDNNLKPGDVLVFELVGNSHFRFTLFDEDGNIGKNRTNYSTQNDATRVRRELSYSSQSQQQPSSSTESDRENPSRSTRNRVILDSDTESDSPESDTRPNSSLRLHGPAVSDRLIIPKPEPDFPETPQKRRRLRKLADIGQATPRHIRSDCEGNGVDSGKLQLHHGTKSPSESFNPLAFTISSKRRPVTAVERQDAKDLAEAHTLLTTSPHFLVVMSDTHVYQRFQLILPDQFVKESGLPATGCRISLEDCTGKTWILHSRENVNFQVGIIRKGWALFALEHLLEEGDVCVFDLNDKEARSIRVHIFRVVQIPEVGRNSLHDHYELQGKASRP